ncbi:MAG: prolipoprotein diacylglyceryl transferase [Rhizobiales bacterium]|nr:prolipoprotein diacylglyceryl transferase [Hyphomicrobiales bacterium]MBO6697415.1 prolipoprotein diacylglyceryl transferase [Hyphomicrobiales bacterium]MBO6736330.1 prolipoprotein diacylglyceryl transferase [Hyphomicrobiales bacterium]MBO6912800.1 prolipoprotein diacylglyceryl transferase [Hyphomicrobiales bacterium]MBO6953968.1 prolipoprotein diacylglyceryl transferase [Hyphomicrobiales bacterium]
MITLTTLPALAFPVIDPVLFEIGPFAIRWYALAYIAGLVGGWWYVRRLVQRPQLWPASGAPYKPEDIDDFLTWATLGVIIGGRLGYVIFYEPARFLADPITILQVWNGGMSFHGGLLGVIGAMILYARKRQASALSLFDIIGAAAPIGLFFGRLANFINGELWGRPTDLPWGMVFPMADDLPRHPSQLYQSFGEGVVLFLVCAIAIRLGGLKRPGLVGGIFTAGYGITRFLAEYVRAFDPSIGLIGGLITMGQLLSLPMILAGLVLIALSRKTPASAAA